MTRKRLILFAALLCCAVAVVIIVAGRTRTTERVPDEVERQTAIPDSATGPASSTPEISPRVLKTAIADDSKSRTTTIVTFDQLSGFPYDIRKANKNSAQASGQIPPEIIALSGKRVVIAGAIVPLKLEKGILKACLLVPNEDKNFYEQKLNQFVNMKLPSPIQFTSVSNVAVNVTGTFHVTEEFAEDKLTGIYQLDVDEIVPTPKVKYNIRSID